MPIKDADTGCCYRNNGFLNRVFFNLNGTEREVSLKIPIPVASAGLQPLVMRSKAVRELASDARASRSRYCFFN